MGVLVVIPARLESKRLRGKLLLPVGRRPLLWHTWSAVKDWPKAAAVVIATADEPIRRMMEDLGATVVSTYMPHETGTSRAIEAATKCEWEGGTIINLQGDQPRATHGLLDAVMSVLDKWDDEGRRAVVATAAYPFRNPAEVGNRNAVKVVVDRFGSAMWFTRLPASYAYHHVGVYGFRRSSAATLARMPRSRHAESEGLEQLDWMYGGWTMPVAVMRDVGPGIDSEADYEQFAVEAGHA